MGDGDSGSRRSGSTCVVLLGPPGSGNGTQAALLAEHLGVPAISTGDMLRQAVKAGNELGTRVEGILASGALVDDSTMADVVRDRLQRPDAKDGFLLDGYPRTLPQGDTLAAILRDLGTELDAVLFLEVPETVMVQRALARHRADDTEEVIRERFRVFHDKTEPLVAYYEKRGVLRRIDGDRTIEEVKASMLAALEG